MTLREFFDFIDANPTLPVAFFAAIPVTALLAGWISREDGRLSPWKYLYSVLIYMVCIPGIFAATLGVYFFLFERGSLMNMDLIVQVLPVISMVFTLAIIQRSVPFEYIPGFGKLSNLMMMIAAILILMFILQRTQLIVWINMRVEIFLLILVGLILLTRYSFRRFIA